MSVTVIRKNLAEEYFTREQAAKFLGCSPRSLDRWHALRTGPDRIRVGRKIVKYRRSTLEAWLAANTEPGTVAA